MGAKRKLRCQSIDDEAFEPENKVSSRELAARKSGRVRKPNRKYGSTEFIVSVGMDQAKRVVTPVGGKNDDEKGESNKNDGAGTEESKNLDCASDTIETRVTNDEATGEVDLRADNGANDNVGTRAINDKATAEVDSNADAGEKPDDAKNHDDTKKQEESVAKNNHAKLPVSDCEYYPSSSSESSGESDIIDLNRKYSKSTPKFLNRFQMSPMLNGQSKSPNNEGAENEEDEEEDEEEEDAEQETNEINFSVSTPTLSLSVFVPAEMAMKATVEKNGKDVVIRFNKN